MQDVITIPCEAQVPLMTCLWKVQSPGTLHPFRSPRENPVQKLAVGSDRARDLGKRGDDDDLATAGVQQVGALGGCVWVHAGRAYRGGKNVRVRARTIAMFKLQMFMGCSGIIWKWLYVSAR